MGDFSAWRDLFTNAGFPIVLAVYLLLRFERKLNKLTKEIKQLNETHQIRKNKKGT